MNIPLNIDWQQILLHFFNFAILVGGLYFLLFKPVKNFIAQREEHYKQLEENAHEQEKRVAEAAEAVNEREKALDGVLAEKKAAAAAEAEEYAARVQAEAKEKAEKILDAARVGAEQERSRILDEANREAVSIAESAIGKLLGDSASNAYDAFLKAAEGDEANEHN